MGHHDPPVVSGESGPDTAGIGRRTQHRSEKIPDEGGLSGRWRSATSRPGESRTGQRWRARHVPPRARCGIGRFPGGPPRCPVARHVGGAALHRLGAALTQRHIDGNRRRLPERRAGGRVRFGWHAGQVAGTPESGGRAPYPPGGLVAAGRLDCGGDAQQLGATRHPPPGGQQRPRSPQQRRDGVPDLSPEPQRLAGAGSEPGIQGVAPRPCGPARSPPLFPRRRPGRRPPGRWRASLRQRPAPACRPHRGFSGCRYPLRRPRP